MATTSAGPAIIADLHAQLAAANERIGSLKEWNVLLTEKLDSLRQYEEDMEMDVDEPSGSESGSMEEDDESGASATPSENDSLDEVRKHCRNKLDGQACQDWCTDQSVD